jgi:hypothetical protein
MSFALRTSATLRANGVNLIGLVRPRHRRTGGIRGLCCVQFSISAAFNAMRFSLRRRYDVVVVYAMRTATILCAAPLRLLGSRITLDLVDETAEAHQREKAGLQGALRARLLVMEEAIRARFANRVIVAHAIHRQLLRDLKIFGSGASNTTRILRSGIPACSERSADSLGWDHQQRQLLEAVDSLLEKETGARPASESSSGVGWRSVELLRHGRQIGWLRSNPWRAEKPTLVFLRSTDIVPAQPIVLELADAISPLPLIPTSEIENKSITDSPRRVPRCPSRTKRLENLTSLPTPRRESAFWPFRQEAPPGH